jgi:uncharacterized 2Fe-2S/4Fe-4S cluster protein (DUF4445 family)
MPEDQILFQPMGRRVRSQTDLTLLELANRAGAGIEAACGGKGRCGKCRVKISGDASPPDESERELLGAEKSESCRLACQTYVKGPASVWIPEASRLHRQVILTAGSDYNVELDPGVRTLDIQVPLPDLQDPSADRERMLDTLNRAWDGDPGIEWETPLSILRGLEGKLRSDSGRLSVTADREGKILDIRPGNAAACLGLAVDLGTTTVVVYLVDLFDGKVLGVQADMNPQVADGEDVVSRISLCQQAPENLTRHSRMVRECIARLAADVCREAGADPGRIFDCTVVGNTAMHHIFLGLNPAHLAMAPYTPVVSAGLTVRSAELDLGLAKEARVYLPPVKAGFVGADAVAMAMALDADQTDEPTLMVDLGTNGEIVLATRDRILCCSTAAGPAFEGGHILWGMRGAPGAVDGVRLAPADGAPELSVIGGLAPRGICGSGLVSLVSQLVAAGAVTPDGAFAPGIPSPRLREGPGGSEFVLAVAQETGTGRDLVLTHRDLAQLQLAKAAIHAGISLMMDEMGVSRISRVLLAGAFGNYLDPADACGIRMLPGVTADRVTAVGNAAGAGAVMALVSRAQRTRARTLVDQMEYLELAVHPRFNEAYLDGMAFNG